MDNYPAFPGNKPSRSDPVRFFFNNVYIIDYGIRNLPNKCVQISLIIRFKILQLKEKQKKRDLLKMRCYCGVSLRQLGR